MLKTACSAHSQAGPKQGRLSLQHGGRRHDRRHHRRHHPQERGRGNPIWLTTYKERRARRPARLCGRRRNGELGATRKGISWQHLEDLRHHRGAAGRPGRGGAPRPLSAPKEPRVRGGGIHEPEQQNQTGLPSRYVALSHWMMRTAAWRDLDAAPGRLHRARRRYARARQQQRPNSCSVREIADALSVGKATAMRALQQPCRSTASSS